MSISEIDKPIHDFAGLRDLLASMGYQIEVSSGYTTIQGEDVTSIQLNSGHFEFTNEGIFVNVDGVRRQVFLYKREYKLKQYGNPRFHIRKCSTIQSFMNKNGSIPDYRLANTAIVRVIDQDDNNIEKEIKDLPLCKYCERMIHGPSPSISTDFVKHLRDNEADTLKENIEVDLFGYTRDWEIVSKGIRERHNYTCENCGLQISDPYDQRYIHVHHKNGRKTDNRESNLQCLCLRCHANIDENHKKRLTETAAKQIIYKEFIRKYGHLDKK